MWSQLFYRPGRLAACLVCLLASGLVGTASAAQYTFSNFTTSHGLPQTQVLAVHQGPEGYLWVGTYGGLSRYNGQTFTNYTARDGLSSNFVTRFATGTDDRLWIGTASGLCYWDEGRFPCLDDTGLAGGRVYDMLPDSEGLWVASDNGLFRIKAGEVVERHVIEGNDDPLVSAVGRDGSGQLWLGTNSGLYRFQEGQDQIVTLPGRGRPGIRALKWVEEGPWRGFWVGTSDGLFHDAGEGIDRVSAMPPGFAGSDVSSLHVDQRGQLWAAGNLGVLRTVDDELEYLGPEQGLPTELVFQVIVDREGVAWMGHDNGLSKLVPGPFAGYTADIGLLSSFVRTINEDSQQRLWLGTRSGVQLVPRLEGEWRVDQSRLITAEDGLPDQRVYSIVFPEPGRAWIATRQGLVAWTESDGVVDILSLEDGLPDRVVLALLHDSRDRTWVGTPMGMALLQEGELVSLDDSLLRAATPYSMLEDQDGRIWIATARHGLLIHEPDGRTRQLAAEQGLSNEPLWDVSLAEDGAVWVGSNGDGLFRVRADGRIKRYTEADGLVDNFVWQVLVDDRQQVWAYTNRGLARFNGSVFRNYGIRDGLLHLEGGATGAFQSSDGQLWFASGDGLMRYDAEREYRNEVPPPVVLERVEVDGRAIEEGEELPYGAESLDFHFAGLSFQDEDALRFRYRLRGLNDSWSPMVDRRSVTYASLAGGDYVFEVVGRNPHGLWSKSPARFTFSIRAPYWTQPWFWALVVTIMGLLLWSGFRWRIRQMEIGRRVLEQQVEERTRELAQANRRLEQASVTDLMTGLFNRRFLIRQVQADVAQVRRSFQSDDPGQRQNLVFLMIDLDHFKEINDRYGHAAGDRVLREFAGVITEQLRESDYVVRWGGEEFLVIARQAQAECSGLIAERIVQAARRRVFTLDDVGNTVSCSCSIGIAAFPFLLDEPDALSWEQVLDVADMAVYQAKARGRDGWVRVKAGVSRLPEDAPDFIRSVITDPEGVAAAGQITLEYS